MLHLHLNAESLSGNIALTKSANDGYSDASFVDSSLGCCGQGTASTTKVYDDNDLDDLQSAIAYQVRRLVRSYHHPYMPHITELILTGPSASHPRFLDVVRAALHGSTHPANDVDLLLQLNTTGNDHEQCTSLFTFATARGAAEIAKCIQEGPVSCAQSKECRQRRGRVYGQRLDEATRADAKDRSVTEETAT